MAAAEYSGFVANQLGYAIHHSPQTIPHKPLAGGGLAEQDVTFFDQYLQGVINLPPRQTKLVVIEVVDSDGKRRHCVPFLVLRRSVGR